MNVKFSNIGKSALATALMATLGLTVVGCTTTPNQTTYRTSATALPSTEGVLEIISVETQKAMNATKQLTKYQESYNATLDYRQRSFDNDKIMIDYIGKPNAVLNSIAIRYGFRYIEVGEATSLPTINFTKYWTTPSNAIIDIDAKLGNSASLAVDKDQKVITLIYPTANSSNNNQ